MSNALDRAIWNAKVARDLPQKSIPVRDDNAEYIAQLRQEKEILTDSIRRVKARNIVLQGENLELRAIIKRLCCGDETATFRRRPKISEIAALVGERFDISMTELFSERRQSNIVLARQITMYLAHKLTINSTPVIGLACGDKDHSTVMYAIKKIKSLRTNNPEINRCIIDIERCLNDVALPASPESAPVPFPLAGADSTHSEKVVA